jgi:hypothetical protein
MTTHRASSSHRLAALITFASASSALAGIVYNGAANGGTQTVSDQGFLAFVAPFSGATQSAASGKTTLVSTGAGLGGYFSHVGAPGLGVPVTPVNPNWLSQNAMNATDGYTVRFDLEITQESHNADNQRAGFVVTLISTNLKGIELGFWTNRVFAYEGGNTPALFTPAEFTSRDNTALTRFDCSVRGNSYALYANADFTAPILTGTLRDYTAFDATAAGLPFNPYTTPNFMFMGDDTSRAQSTTQIALLSVDHPCYANCDMSTAAPLLSAGDFVCYLNRFRTGDPYANCDESTGSPALTAADFVCFLNAFRAGCP